MSVIDAEKQITQAVLQWPQTVSIQHRFGGIEYQFGKREIGYIHGNTLVDIPFPKAIRNELIESGLAKPHHILPDSGWISFYIRQPEDVDQAIQLLHRSYILAQEQAAKRHPATPRSPEESSSREET